MKPSVASESKSFATSPGTLRGMALMLLSALFMVALSACVRHLSSQLHPLEIGFFRIVFGVLVLTPVFARQGMASLKATRHGLIAVRGMLQAAGILLFFVGLGLSPLAQVTALNFSAPLFAALLAILLLGEVVRTRRIVALAVGFAGTLVILRPGIIEIDLGSVLVLLAALTWGLSMIVIKVLSRTESGVTITIYSTLWSLPPTFVAAVFYWETPALHHWAWFVALGVLGTFGNLIFIQAFKESDVTALLPLDFTKLIWAAVVGYLAFAEIPDVWTWVGGTIIFSAATYIAYGEARVKAERQARTPPPGAGGR